MAIQAVATLVKEENYQAILSEAGSSFDRDFLEKWVVENGEGYFLRDGSSPLDCCLFPLEDFKQLYMFQNDDERNLFRFVERI